MNPATAGALVRTWTPSRIRAEIDGANVSIKQALAAGDMDKAMALVSRKVGMRVCSGDIAVTLKPSPMAA